MCTQKHTTYQPSDEQWRCPHCEEREDFLKDDYVFENDDICELLHENDVVACGKCHHSWSGKQVSLLLMQKNQQIVCPTCKGRGTVSETCRGKKERR